MSIHELDLSDPLSESVPIDLDQVRIDPAWSLSIPASLALRKRVLPLCRLGDEVAVACAITDDPNTIKNLNRFIDQPVRLVEAEPESLRRALIRIYGGASVPSAADPSPLRFRGRGERGADVDYAVSICDELLQAAVLRDASDIHLVPQESQIVVKFRVDGKLEVYRDFPSDLQGAMVSRLKVMAGLDIAEKRAAQDGRFTTRIGPAQLKIDIRAATLPTRFGERVTLRLLAAQGTALSLTSLGMNEQD